ncbi:MAG: metal-dependent transcriptional regulator [Chloroflexi bacterium]|nr:metal-dependent transcriptional regulator [Chloroflexota bacterium]
MHLMSRWDPEVSRSVEDYLKAIYTLQESGGAVRTSTLAERMGVAAPSATSMVARLAAGGFLRHTPYRGVELTEKGSRIALEIIRHHRLWEAFLHHALDVPIDQLNEEAERLEHVLSDELEAHMVRVLGDPTHDPHGDPIPSADGTVDSAVYPNVTDLPDGASATVRRVPSEDPALLRYLKTLGLLPGASIVLRRREPFHGPLTLTADGVERVIGRELAGQILVEPGSPPELPRAHPAKQRRRRG